MSIANYILQCVVFVDLLAVGLIVPLLPNHVQQLGGSHIKIGLLGTIYACFQLGSGPLIGSLGDIKGRKVILSITLLACSIAYTLLGFTSSIAFILFLRAILGLFKQTQVLTRALVPDYEKNEQIQAEIYGKMAAISGVGITLGPVIAGHIAEDHPEHGFTIIAIIVGICFIINSVLTYLLPKTNLHSKRKYSTPSEGFLHTCFNSLKQSIVELYKIEWSNFWDVFMFKALIGFAMGVYYSNYSLYLKSQYELSPKYIGYVISFQGVIGSLSSFFMGKINSFYKNDKDYSLRNFHVFLLLCFSIVGLIFSFNVYLYLIWLIPLAVGNAIGRLVTLEMILKRSDDDHRGTLIGASNSVRSLSGVVAPMVSGYIGQYFGVSYVIYAPLCATILGGVISYYRRRKLKKE